MPQHEFGIMERAPSHGERYEIYEPLKYACVSVDDALIEPLLPKLSLIDLFWHSLDVPGKGLAYCGITLIPPWSLGPVIQVIDTAPAQSADELDELYALKKLLSEADFKGKYVIHFGI